jgi:tetratricopeptide (TPR) repeat protein
MPGEQGPALPFADFRLTPHYPGKSPLDEVLRYVEPGSDEYVTEKYAAEIARRLEEWGQELRSGPSPWDVLAKFLDASLQAAPLVPAQEKKLRSGYGVDVFRRTFSNQAELGRERFLEEVRNSLAPLGRLRTAEFQIAGIEQTADSPLNVRIAIRYDLVGQHGDTGLEERIGYWLTEWTHDDAGGWRVFRWTATEETLSRARQPIFLDVTQQALGQTESYRNQMLHGMDYWRTVLDGATGMDVYGNTGLAAGDFDNDGLDDLYICQPPGLPNRLYRNRGDGTFEDVTEAAGVGVLDRTACALFADFENKGLQDLLVVCATGPLLFVNQGNGKFKQKRDAFRFVNAPEGAFTHAAVADYDRDGRLDIYFCLYNYYLGLDQYHYPVPYFDARNGPPNFLFHNEGNGVFQDRTAAAGMNVDNDRYSFACCWGDYNSDGWPDLYVANDFGRNNLYRNNGDGTFATVSGEAHVEEAGAGMSACWLDFDNDGNQDIYAAGMWVAAGMRVFGQAHFHDKEPEEIRALYRRHMAGNSLYRNLGNGQFQNVAMQAGVEMGRWSWSTDAWDFDHDGYPDLYMANGYISGHDARDVSSFFWRQVVAKSPRDATPSESYERGWNAINELIRSDATWNGFERNVFYLNNRDGTFSEVSGVVGLDFIDDSRSFVLADLDHDGRLEVVLKNRTAPQLRVLHNAMKDLGSSIAFRLQGKKSNRDAIGAAVTLEAAGLRQTKYLQAGSGFLSQHSKELFFGLGKAEGRVRASIRWPSGLTQGFENLPANHRIEVQEGAQEFHAKPFAASSPSYAQGSAPQERERLPLAVETWLIQPLLAPDFSLPDLLGDTKQLHSHRGNLVLLHFWATAAPSCASQLRLLQQHQADWASRNLRVLCLNLDDPQDAGAVRSFATKEGISLPILLATQEVAGVYNIIYRYLFDRHRDMSVPISFLIDPAGNIVKLYQGPTLQEQFETDFQSIPQNDSERLTKALPFAGVSDSYEFGRNYLSFGFVFFERGYFEQAEAFFRQAVKGDPNSAEALYGLGSACLQQQKTNEARECFQRALQLRASYPGTVPNSWNNLGILAAREGNFDLAIQYFRRALQIDPEHSIALRNLGSAYRQKKDWTQAESALERALALNPDDPEANYSLGMVYAQQNDTERAYDYLRKALASRPAYPEALNNLGILYLRTRRPEEAKRSFEESIRVAPTYDQAYLNLARVYAIEGDREKAKAVLLELLKQHPDHAQAKEELKELEQ